MGLMYKVNKNRRHVVYAEKKFRKELRKRRTHNGRVIKRKIRLAQQERARTSEPSRTLRMAPANFSILENREGVIDYFHSVKSLLDANEYTEMNLSHVTSIDLPTLCLLSAFMLDSRTNAMFLSVISPKHGSRAYKMFEATQFENMIIAKKRADFNSGAFLSQTDMRVNEPPIRAVLDKTITFFGAKNRKKLNDLHPIIVEIVTNTANHANPDEKNVVPWIVNTYETEKDNKKIKQYCMVDLGIGIYESMSERTEQWRKQKKKLRSWMRDLKGSSESGFFSAHIPYGIQSTTTLPERGKGIKYIYDTVSNDDMYKRFEIITNKAHVDFMNINDVKKDTKSNLSATVYYWEISLV